MTEQIWCIGHVTTIEYHTDNKDYHLIRVNSLR